MPAAAETLSRLAPAPVRSSRMRPPRVSLPMAMRSGTGDGDTMCTLRLRAASSVVHVGADSASARNWAGGGPGPRERPRRRSYCRPGRRCRCRDLVEDIIGVGHDRAHAVGRSGHSASGRSERRSTEPRKSRGRSLPSDRHLTRVIDRFPRRAPGCRCLCRSKPPGRRLDRADGLRCG
jgi:hypothetical protein